MRILLIKKVGEVNASTHQTIIEYKNMIIEYDVSIKAILEQGKNFSWTKPKACPCCDDNVLWGHGFTLCYFSKVDSGIYLKRYFCSSCKSIIKLKPSGFFKKFRTCIRTIKKSLIKRIKKKIIKNNFRSRQDYWLRNLRKNVRSVLGEEWKHRLIEGFEKLLDIGIIPVSCSVRKI